MRPHVGEDTKSLGARTFDSAHIWFTWLFPADAHAAQTVSAAGFRVFW